MCVCLSLSPLSLQVLPSAPCHKRKKKPVFFDLNLCGITWCTCFTNKSQTEMKPFHSLFSSQVCVSKLLNEIWLLYSVGDDVKQL